MSLLAADVAATGLLRPQLSVEKTADIIWSMNSPEFYILLVEQRGWSPQGIRGLVGECLDCPVAQNIIDESASGGARSLDGPSRLFERNCKGASTIGCQVANRDAQEDCSIV